MEADFWSVMDELIATSTIVIDRPKGSRHPRYSQIVYPYDYGYLEDSFSIDMGCIDVWVGSAQNTALTAVICTVDILKRDSEIKLLLGCDDVQQNRILEFHNDSEYMRGILIKRG